MQTKRTKSAQQEPPDHFAIVESGVYRASLPQSSSHFSFLSHLALKSILNISQEIPSKQLLQFCANNSIELKNFGMSPKIVASSFKHAHVREELVKESLECIINHDNHPMVIVCATGLHITGTIVGCLRRLQFWSLTSILAEYRSFTGNSKARYANEQYIELFDPSLICVPERPPQWLTSQMELMRQEKLQQYNTNADENATSSNNAATNTATMANNNTSTTSSQVLEITSAQDPRLGFQVYKYVIGPLLTPKSQYTEESLIDDDDFD